VKFCSKLKVYLYAISQVFDVAYAEILQSFQCRTMINALLLNRKLYAPHFD